MNPAMLMMLVGLLQSGKLDGLLGQVPGLGALKGAVGPPAEQPTHDVQGALALLEQHAPREAAQAQAYVEAVASALKAAITLKALVA